MALLGGKAYCFHLFKERIYATEGCKSWENIYYIKLYNIQNIYETMLFM